MVSKIGNLTADPELRFAASGKAYCWMRLAVTNPKVPGDWAGERETTFYGLTTFGSLGEHAAENLKKGDRVVVMGRGETRTWTDKEGTEHSEKQIVVDGLGPDLRFATANVQRVARREVPAGSDAPESSDDEEPF
ncbi:MAG: single-stranded DNA-binding protein [Acidimicrobiales bacterium]